MREHGGGWVCARVRFFFFTADRPSHSHPPRQLVLINVADDATRARVIGPAAPPVAGVLLGKPGAGGGVDVANSFSVTVSPDGAVDGALLAKRLDQCALGGLI